MRIKALLASALAVLSLGITSCDNEEEKVLEIEGVVINVSSAELTIGDTLVISAIVQPYGLDPARKMTRKTMYSGGPMIPMWLP